jgi:hypothetical protein
MLINFNHLKTFGNAIIQKMKDFRGDWNQNDPTADDYIKNRPFYSEGVKETTLVPETSFDFDRNNQISNPFRISLVAGHTYTVVFDDVTYKTVAKETYAHESFIGNSSILGWNDNVDTGEPFFIDVWTGDGTPEVTFAVNDYGIHTISILGQTEIIHKLDKKFIDMPDGIVTEESLYPILEENLAPVAFTNNYDSLSGKPTIYTDVVRYNNSQSLTTTQKLITKNNINAVGYDAQTLTDTQKEQARSNIGASSFSGNYNDLSDKPSCLEIESVVAGNLPVVENWTSVCYGNGTYVAISGISGSRSNIVAYSTNGITWEQSNLPTTSAWNSVCYGDGKFVAIDFYGKTAYSLDGINWTSSSLSLNTYPCSGCYGNGKFVVLSNNSNKIAYSTDGINWITGISNITLKCNSVCYGNDKFVSVGYFNGSNRSAYYSTDGITWTSVNMPSYHYWSSVCYGNGKFVAIC